MNYQTLARAAFIRAAHFVEDKADSLPEYDKADLTDMIAALLRFSATETQGQTGYTLLASCRRHAQLFVFRLTKKCWELLFPSFRLEFQMNILRLILEFNGACPEVMMNFCDAYELTAQTLRYLRTGRIPALKHHVLPLSLN